MKGVMAVLAAMVLVGAMVAAPASADTKPINGKVYMEFVGPAEDCSFGGGNRTWVGTVEIDGVTYGWADFLIDIRFEGKFLYGTEYWTIFAIQDDLVADSCNPDLVLIDGTSLGRGTPGDTGQAEGEVETATGPFADVEPGARMFWRGKVVDDAGTQFKATLHIH